ncbi:MAG: hypothetical protein Q9178_002136 [Gyalolechia marmorata]
MLRSGDDPIAVRWQRKREDEERAIQAQVSGQKAAALQRYKGEARPTQLYPAQMAVGNDVHQAAERHHSRLGGLENYIAELDAPPSYQQRWTVQQPLTPPLTVTEASSHTHNQTLSHDGIRQLRTEVQQQKNYIGELVKELKYNTSEVARLRAESRSVRAEHIRAIDDDDAREMERLRRKLDGFKQHLAEAADREKELDTALEKAKSTETGLRQKLHQLEREKMDLENDITRLRVTDTAASVRAELEMGPTQGAATEATVRSTPSCTTGRNMHGEVAGSDVTARTSASSRKKAVYQLSVHRGDRGAFGSSKIIKNFVPKLRDNSF